jgi:hypothetical protein
VSEGRYEPQNFPFFTISAADVAWDWTTSSSDYATVRAAKTKAADNAGWQIESSLDLNTQMLANQVAFGPTAQLMEPQKPAVRPSAGREGGAPEKSEAEQRAEDLDVLFGGAPARQTTVRVTRMRADLAHSALSKDLRVQASSDQTLVSNVVQVTREKSPPACPVYDDKCTIIGNAPRPEAEKKNKALSDPHFAGAPSAPGDASGKKLLSCGATPRSTSSSEGSLLVAAAIAAAAIARRKGRDPR